MAAKEKGVHPGHEEPFLLLELPAEKGQKLELIKTLAPARVLGKALET